MANRNLTLFNKNKFDPWSSFQDEMKDLIQRFSGDEDLTRITTPSHFVPKVDVKDEGKSYFITAEIPGMSQDDINISVEENVLTLEGEKKSESKKEGKDFYRSEISYGSFYRTIPLRDEVDEAQANASYENGMLKITLPKKENTEKKSRKISISNSKQSSAGKMKQ